MKRALSATIFAAALVAASAGVALTAGSPARAATTYKVLFDDTKAEEAGNADWIISTSKPDPLAENASPRKESDWTGALSSWGVSLQRTGNYSLKTLSTGPITYGGGGALDLKNFNTFVLPEPNTAFTAAEKTAIMTFVKNGGGLFMISDHDMSDRNNDGIDAIGVLNDLMTNNSVDSNDPFGFSIDKLNIDSEDPDVINPAAPTAVTNGPFGKVTGTIIRNGTTATLTPADNAAVRGVVYRTGYSASGTTGAAVVTSTFGSGRVAFWGDSSPIDDGTGQSGNTLYDGWNDTGATDAAVALNTTQWLAGGTAISGSPTPSPSPSPSASSSAKPTPTPTPTATSTPSGSGASGITNGGFENGAAPWTLTGAQASIVPSQAHGGTHSMHLGSAASETDSGAQTFTVPASGTLTWWTRMTTTDTSGTAHDTLTVSLGSTALKTFNNTGTTATWQSSSVSLASYAGQSVTLTYKVLNDASSPTTFWVDDVTGS